jgi:hypothetical protein
MRTPSACRRWNVGADICQELRERCETQDVASQVKGAWPASQSEEQPMSNGLGRRGYRDSALPFVPRGRGLREPELARGIGEQLHE